MRHVAFYYAIGFAAVGILMLIFTVMTFAGIPPATRDPVARSPWNMAVLTSTAILPFIVSTLSWREWRMRSRVSVAIDQALSNLESDEIPVPA
jgi:hypothetical protein